MIKKLFLIILVTFIAIHSILGQQYYTRNYNVNDGVPDDCIRDIFKDSRGFLWIGTEAGLSRFDGKNFNIYTSQDGLAGNKIRSITEGENGNIWVGCYDGGISRLNGKDIISYDISSGLISNTILKIHYSKKHKILLIGTENGLTIYDGERFISFHEKLNNVKNYIQVTDFLENEEFIYVLTNEGKTYKYIHESGTLVRNESGSILNRYLINSAYFSNSVGTLVGIKGGDFYLLKDGKNKVFNKTGEVLGYAEDKDNNLWIAASRSNYGKYGGIFKCDGNNIINWGKHLNFDSKDVFCVKYDEVENLLWIGTKEHGLYMYPLSGFAYFNPEYFNLSELKILDMSIDESYNLWIATNSNLIKKKGDNTYKVFDFDVFFTEFEKFTKKKIKNKYSYLNDQNGSYQSYEHRISDGSYYFSNPYITPSGDILPEKSLYKPLKYEVLVNKKLKELNSVVIDSDENVWVGSNVGIFRIDKDSEEVSFHDMEGHQFKSIEMDSNDRIYGVSWGDLLIYPKIMEGSNYYSFDYYEDKSPINVTKIKAQNNKIWFISEDHGLFLYLNDQFYSNQDDTKVDCKSFNDICFDNHGNVIVGGNNGKVYIVDFKENIQLKYEIGKNTSLKGTSIRYLSCTKDNMLIVGTNAGINLIDLNKLYNTGDISINTIDESRGLIDYSGQTSLMQDTNKLWIGSNNKLITADLGKLKVEKSNDVNLYIKSVEINNEEFDLSTITKSDEWTNIPKSSFDLPFSKNSITINYDAIKYLDHDNISFGYKLEGYHDKWIEETKDRKITFQNLKPGKYRLRIKMINRDENNGEQELLLYFNILSPFWFKWWFICMVTFSLIAVVWSFVYVRSRSIKKFERQRTEIAERISEFEMKALRAQMNPHFIFNVINSIQNYMLDNNIDEALNYLSDFAKLIRLTLDNVSKKLISLDDELKYLEYYLNLEQMRFGKKFEIDINLPVEFDSRRFLIPSMILQPYVENSIKHGFPYKHKGGKINLDFQLLENNFLKCIIEDNGIGREKAREMKKSKVSYSSKGTYITNERLELLNQTQDRKGFKVEIIDLYDERDVAKGTRVEIFIPL